MNTENSQNNVQNSNRILSAAARAVAVAKAVAGDTPTKKAGAGVAAYGLFNLDLVTTGAGLALRFHDKVDNLAAGVKEFFAGAKELKDIVDEANAEAQVQLGAESDIASGVVESDKVDKSWLPKVMAPEAKAHMLEGLSDAERRVENGTATAADIALVQLAQDLDLVNA